MPRQSKNRGRLRQVIRYHKRKLDTFTRMGGKCVDCGITDYRVIHFDHVLPGKKYEPALCPNHAWEAEMTLCVPRCANCHTIKTWY